MRKGMVGTHGQRNIATLRRTKKAAFSLLSRASAHYKTMGEKAAQTRSNPIDKPLQKIRVTWARKAKMRGKELVAIRNLPVQRRRILYQKKVQVFKLDTVPELRASLPNIFGQGFLRKKVSVFPYRPMDTFLAQHRVNVYRNGSRFDVIDALCNIPILSGITRRHLKGVVAW